MSRRLRVATARQREMYDHLLDTAHSGYCSCPDNPTLCGYHLLTRWASNPSAERAAARRVAVQAAPERPLMTAEEAEHEFEAAAALSDRLIDDVQEMRS